MFRDAASVRQASRAERFAAGRPGASSDGGETGPGEASGAKRVPRPDRCGLAAVGVVLASGVLIHPRSITAARSRSRSEAAIWAMLTEVDRYDEWKPHITRASGRSKKGRPSTSVTHGEAEADVLIVRPLQKIEWRSRTIAPGVLDLEQIFRVILERPGSFTSCRTCGSRAFSPLSGPRRRAGWAASDARGDRAGRPDPPVFVVVEERGDVRNACSDPLDLCRRRR